MNGAPPGLRRREIGEGDLPAVVDLLLRGFAVRPRAYWERGLARMAARPAVPGCPRYGFLLDDGSRPVGVSLMLFGRDLAGAVRCNLSSWTVDPAYRAQAPLLVASALARRDVTFTNISPAPHTWPTIEAQGFRAYAEGQAVAIPMLGRGDGRARVSADPAAWRGLPEAALLADHAAWGCHSLAVEAGGALHPLVLVAARARAGSRWLPLMQLVYCRDIGELAGLAGALGRWMLRRGAAGLILDGDPPPGLPGVRRVRGARRYARGPSPPRVGDLSYTELAIFGP